MPKSSSRLVRKFRPLVAALLLVIGSFTAAPRAIAEEPVSYNRDVRPILSDSCFYCHGPDENHRKAGLRLDVEEEAKSWVIDVEDPAASELLARIDADDPELQMPPADSDKRLDGQQQEILRRWVQQGAPYEASWAYVDPVWHEAPEIQHDGVEAQRNGVMTQRNGVEVQHGDWADNWVDRFLLAGMQREGMAPSPDADPITLIRRVTFDLTGLPPTPAEVEAFVADPSLPAYEAVVDRLLASDAFGERMAMYWLDLVRYADTVGYHGDQDQNISPYRDYVIHSFNDNLPLDQFTIEQLAGDLLPNPTIDQLIATGYNRLLQTSHEGGVQPEEYLAIYGADRVRNVSNVWMAATVGCAQCHDHKFDPYTLKDFTAMKAFFDDIDEAQHFSKGTNSLPTARPPEIDVLSRQQRAHITRLQHRIEDLQFQAESADAQRKNEIEQSIAALKAEMAEIEGATRKTMITVSIEPRPTRLLPRGNWLDDSGPLIEPAVPEFVGTLQPRDDAGRPRRANRLDLARWLTDAEDGAGGLTARVFANRFWYLMFGTGISATLDDFGGQGQPPAHPKLLDNLAVEFVRNGWDVKRQFKLMAMSRAYRQSSRATAEQRDRDPLNQIVARQSRYRLPAEMVRDNALAISGLLVHRIGGPSIKPYQPAGYYRHLNFPKREYHADQDQKQWRRGVYMHWQRQFLHPMLKALDAPSREECTVQRSRSNTPLEALVLLNDPTFVEAAHAFAGRILRSPASSTQQRLTFAFRHAVSRQPDQVEQQTLAELLAAERDRYAEDAEAVENLRTKNGLAEVKVPEDVEPAELAAWTSVARVILNLNETVTRN